MSGRDDLARLLFDAAEQGDEWDGLLVGDRVGRARAYRQADAVLAEVRAQGQASDLHLAPVVALADEWWGRATEATSDPLSWRRVCMELRIAIAAARKESL